MLLNELLVLCDLFADECAHLAWTVLDAVAQQHQQPNAASSKFGSAQLCTLTPSPKSTLVTQWCCSGLLCLRAQLVQAKEESVEMGGYFICNGIERIIRMLIQQRRHYIMALRRGAYHKRGPNYTDAATLLRYCSAVSLAVPARRSLTSHLCTADAGVSPLEAWLSEAYYKPCLTQTTQFAKLAHACCSLLSLV